MPSTMTPRDKREIGALAVSPPAPVDLVQLSNAWVVRAWRDGANLRIDKTRDGGATWQGSVIATGLANVDQPHPGDLGAAPTICADRWDQMWCWFHDAASVGYAVFSADGGNSWVPWATHAALQYPRMVLMAHAQLVVGHDGADLRAYGSSDFGVTLTARGLFPAVPTQRVSLQRDRRGLLHLVYRFTGGLILHRYSADEGENWTTPTVFVSSAEVPAYAVGDVAGVLAEFQDTAPEIRRTDETYGVVGSPITPPGITPGKTWAGVLIDERNLWWYVARPTTNVNLATRISADQGVTWFTPS